MLTTRPFLRARRRALQCLAIAACALGGTGSAMAQAAYPAKTIRIICAHAPGGAADTLSRIVAERLQVALNQTVIVENKPGASTMLAAEYVIGQPADGYTVLMATVTTLSINPSLFQKIRYSPVKDFAPITTVASTPFFLGVNASLPVHNAAEAIKLGKEKPGELNYGSSGSGTSSHLAGELFAEMSGTQLVHVPYKATATRNTDLSSGAIQLVFGNDLLNFAKTGKVRILGVTAAKRLSGYPDIPTVAEAAGLPGYEASVWYGLVARAGTPAPIVDKLNTAVREIMARPDVRAQVMAALGGDAGGSSVDEFRKLISSDLEKWRRVIARANVKFDE
jgi:tripartite-type tricarboxylate transporter receptor subunit TctC